MDNNILEKINNKNIPFFRFKKIDNDNYLLTNDAGGYVILSIADFEYFLTGKLKKSSRIYKELSKTGFFKDSLNLNNFIERVAKRYSFLNQGPSLHIVVLTARCNYNCIYCQASSPVIKSKSENFDMDFGTAKQVVDIIFKSPSRHISIEFQGGEPLLNFETLKFITEYAQELNKMEKRDLEISLISNFSLLDDEKIKFLLDHKVGICTSLDGPPSVHNRNRIFEKNNSYKTVVENIKKLIKKYRYLPSLRQNRLNALATVTRFSLPYFKEIINEYINLGFPGIHLRLLNPFGIAKIAWGKIGYTPEEFLNFYKKSFNYIISLNFKRKFFYERTAMVFLKKIMTDDDPNFFELRSPCGAGIGQLAYNYNGDVYTCDEGRMLSKMGDELVRLGNVKKNKYSEIVGHDAVKTLCHASCLDNLPYCSSCAYKPYCGTCPVYNYVDTGNIFAQMPNSNLCKINMGILDYLFDKLKDHRIKKIFQKWIKTEY